MSSHVPGVIVPAGVLERMSKCSAKEDGIKAGIEIAHEIRERIAGVVAGFQVSAPMGRVNIALDVLAERRSAPMGETGGLTSPRSVVVSRQFFGNQKP